MAESQPMTATGQFTASKLPLIREKSAPQQEKLYNLKNVSVTFEMYRSFPEHIILLLQCHIRFTTNQHLTLLYRSTSGDCSGVLASSSIMVSTVSGTWVMSLHFSCHVASFMDRISLAWAEKETEHRVCVGGAVGVHGPDAGLRQDSPSRGSC